MLASPTAGENLPATAAEMSSETGSLETQNFGTRLAAASSMTRNAAGGLPLFEGPHLRARRLADAIRRRDLRDAAANAQSPEDRQSFERLKAVVEDDLPMGLKLGRLVSIREAGWSGDVERAWQLSVGDLLDTKAPPACLRNEPAGAFFLRGGEPKQALQSLERYVARKPKDARAWELLATITLPDRREAERVRDAAVARCGFHCDVTLEQVSSQLLDVIDVIKEDDIESPAPWLLAYAWFADLIEVHDIEVALDAEGITNQGQLPFHDESRAFAWHLVQTLRNAGADNDRKRLREISPRAYRRYLDRIASRPIHSPSRPA